MNLSIESSSTTANRDVAGPFVGAAELPTDFHRPATRPGTELDMGELLRFKDLMRADGQRVHVARMCYDRHYAYERIASAHASANDPLRRVALGLFQVCHRRDEARSARG